MPNCRGEIPFFVMFRGSTMGMRRKFVLFSGFPVRLVRFDIAREMPVLTRSGASYACATQSSHGCQ